MLKNPLTIAALLALAGSAHGQVIITEVMYNPSGDEAETEYLEVTNVGPVAVDISRYAFDDEDGSTPSHMFGTGEIRLPDGTVLPRSEATECTTIPLADGGGIACQPIHQLIIQPGESIIISSPWDRTNPTGGGNTTNAQISTIDEFIQSWGEDTDGDDVGDTVDYTIVFIRSQITIANTASDTNEVLELIEILEDGTLASRDFSNYQVGNSQNQWPFSSNGRSIYLQPNFYQDAASTELPGEAWALSVAGRDGGIEGREVIGVSLDDPEDTFTLFGEGDAGSPGVAVTLAQSFEDANNNGRDDALDIFLGTSLDCNRNRIPDESEPDCNGNGIPDGCEFQINQEDDCDGDGQPDDCQIDNNPGLDANNNGTLDSCEAIAGFGDVVITEIMFNPSGSEREWIELYNTGSAPVNIAGWFFQDLDQPVFDGVDGTILADTDTDMDGEADAFFINPGEVVVIGEVSLEAWEAAWGPVVGYRYQDADGSLSLANNADLVNEVRSILAPVVVGQDPVTGEDIVEGVRIDVANYQGTTSNGVPQGGWPGDDGRGSFFALASGVDAEGNNNGGNWALSIRGVDSARAPLNTGTFDGRDAGSPGFVNTGAPIRPTGDVIISEIHFATNSDFPGLPFPDETPGLDEWVEIVNTSNAPIDISGWTLEDEDGATTPFPAGTVLQAGEAAVIVGWDFVAENPTPVSEFYAAWQGGYQVIAVNNWYQGGLNRLGDAAEFGTGSNPSTGREILTLRTAADEVQDVVNYDDDGFVWPLVSNGLPFNFAFSIYVFNPADYNELENDNGLNWATSLAGFDGAIQSTATTVFNALAFGSPGFVDGLTAPLDPGFFPSADPIIPLCADQNGDGELSGADFNAFISNFGAGDLAADINGDGVLTGADFNAWLTAFSQGPAGPLCE